MSQPVKIDLPFVTVRKNADGTLRHYFQRKGQPLVRLPGLPLAPEFMAAYRACADATPDPARGPGSFGWACEQYMASPEWSALKPSTQRARQLIITSMVAERLDPKHSETFGMERIANFTRRHVAILRDRKSHAPNAANERMKILGRIFRFAIESEWIETNPVRDVRRPDVATDGHETATDAQLASYMAFHHRSGTANLAMRLLMAFGMRVSDLRRIGPGNVQGGNLVFRTAKTGMTCELPIPADLLPVLKASRAMVFLTTAHGAAYASDKAMSAAVAKWIRQAGIERVTAHGVRKWLATKMAERGATEAELMAFFGWQDGKEAKPYISKASRRIMAAGAARKMGG